MALTEIEYGALASSEVMNNNFEYLDNRISGVSESVVGLTATMNSNIATINNSITAINEEINEFDETIETINANIAESCGLRKLVEKYSNGASWYEVFEETNPETGEVKLWCRQAGYQYLGTVATVTAYITFLKAFKDTNYTIVNSAVLNSNSGGNGENNIKFFNKQVGGISMVLTFTGSSQGNQNYCNWIAEGYIEEAE